ncbi:MAG: PIN domain-containing protein [Bacteroidia bacterium]|nr:PIN domain-containing protein [Bacteroidia bacterium]
MNKSFIDSNILVYLASTNIDKANKAKELLNKGEELFISIQVLNEFSAVCFKKELAPHEKIKKYVEEFHLCFNVAGVDFLNISKCFDIKMRYKYSYYDSLIIATALINDCPVLYSEDMQHNQLIENKLTIINPFI